MAPTTTAAKEDKILEIKIEVYQDKCGVGWRIWGKSAYFWEELAERRFGPGNGSLQDALEEARAALEELEQKGRV